MSPGTRALLILALGWFAVNRSRALEAGGSAGGRKDPLALVPELQRDVRRLRDNSSPGNAGQIELVEDAARTFAKVAYRYVGRDPSRVSALDRSAAPETLHVARSDLVNAIQALYTSTERERRRRVIDEVTRSVLAETEAYVQMALSTLRKAGVAPDNLYEPGRGFPRALPQNGNSAYDVMA